jgi:hypothetical protein
MKSINKKFWGKQIDYLSFDSTGAEHETKELGRTQANNNVTYTPEATERPSNKQLYESR